MHIVMTILCVVTLGWSISAIAADGGPYVGVRAGAYTLDVDDVDFDDGDTVYGAFGGFRFNDHWAVEVDYHKLQESEDTILGIDVGIDADSWSVSVRPIFPITDLVDIYGRVGWAWYDVELNASSLGIGVSDSESDSDLIWGGGIDINLGDRFSLRGEVTRIEISDADLNMFSIGALFRF